MEVKSSEQEVLETATRGVYELGYLVHTGLSEEDLSNAVSALKALLEKEGGTVIAQEHPVRTSLAYTIAVFRTGRRERHEDAYFGSLKFELSSDRLAFVREGLLAQESIIRYLLITTVAEDTRAPKRLFQKTEAAPTLRPAVRFAEKDVPKTPVSDEELDRSLAGVVVE